jgi:hypothetical protein
VLWIDEAKRADIYTVASHMGLKGRVRSLGPCPACQEDKRGSNDRRGPLGVAKNGKSWRCYRCEVYGDVVDLVCWVRQGVSSKEADFKLLQESCAELGLCDHADGHQSSGRSTNARRRSSSKAKASGGATFGWEEGLAEACQKRLWTEEGAKARAYLIDGRKFTEETLKEWLIGYVHLVGMDWITIPLRDESRRIVNVRFRSVGEPTGKKQYRVCTDRPLPLFGAHTLTVESDHPVIIAEGEFDVMALWQYGFMDNLVTGTTGATSWADEWLDLLEHYENLVLCYDNDEAGEKGVALLTEKMGAYKCSRALLEHNDAAECQKQGVSSERVKRAIGRAKPLVGITFKRVSEYEDQIEESITNPDRMVGLPTGSSKLDKMWGGIRPGLIIISGETGHGKSSWANWLCREQALRGIPVSITSFEDTPELTAQKFLRNQLGGDLLKRTKEQRHEAFRQYVHIPLQVVDHSGHIHHKKMMDVIRFSSRRFSTRIFLIDHLGYVVDPEASDERRAIDRVIRDYVTLGLFEGVAILLICHPGNRHLNQQRRADIGDLKGASAIRQDSHDVIMVEKLPKTKNKRPSAMSKIHLDKSKSPYGHAGESVDLFFDPYSCTYHDRYEQCPNAGKKAIDPKESKRKR